MTDDAPAYRLAAAALVVLVVALSAVRLWLAAIQPLWFDETWTAMVAAAPWRDLPHLWRVDPNPPLYYLSMKLWAQLAGSSDLALRAPGIAAVAMAAFLPGWLGKAVLKPFERLAWGALVFSWWVIDQFLWARGYPLMTAVAVVQLILLIRLIARPSLALAFGWCAAACASVLIHYYAVPIVAAQGMTYLVVCRMRAVRTWPALIAFAPAALWGAWHFPFLIRFADPSVAWHPALDMSGAVRSMIFAVHPTAPMLAVTALALVTAAILLSRGAPRESEVPGQIERATWIALAACWIGLALVIASAIWRPSLILRYLTPEVPGVLLTLVILTRRTRWPKLVLTGLCALYAAVLPTPLAATRGPASTSPYGHERASEFLIAHQVSDVVYLWDQETAAIQDQAAMQALGGYFFARAGHPVGVIAPAWTKADDLNVVALAAATGPRPGVIWTFNQNTNTAAHRHPPILDQLDPHWICQRFVEEGLGTAACYRTSP